MQEAAGIENEEYFQREFKKVLSEYIDCLETYEYADETEDISISLGDGWNHTASISYPY